MPRASIVVPTRDRPDRLRASLPALERARRCGDAEVVLVAQGDVASVEAVVADGDAEAHVVADPGFGASRARNLGIEQARGAVVLFTDDDCDVPESWVVDHLDALDADPGAVASFGQVLGLSRTGDGDATSQTSRHLGRVPAWRIGHGSNAAVRTAELRAVGGFDERIGPGTVLPAGEDAELIHRLLRTGRAVLTGVGAPVRHQDWRTEDEHRANLRAYRHGAGVALGAALRAEGWAARGMVRGRLALEWGEVEDAPWGERARRAAWVLPALGRGLVAGLLLAPRVDEDPS